MTYRFVFNVTGCFEVEADSEDEAWEEFDSIEDYSEFINTTDVYDIFVEESR